MAEPVLFALKRLLCKYAITVLPEEGQTVEHSHWTVLIRHIGSGKQVKRRKMLYVVVNFCKTAHVRVMSMNKTGQRVIGPIYNTARRVEVPVEL